MKKIVVFVFALAGSAAFAALSGDVRDNFLGGCEDGNTTPEFCECVFAKVEKNYSQSQIDAIELKMRRGHSDLGYSEFIKNAATECEAKIRSGASLGSLAASEQRESSDNADGDDGYTEMEAAFAQGMLTSLLASPEYKNVFIAECSVEFLPYFGQKLSNKSCECAYAKLGDSENSQKLLKMVNESGNFDDSLALEWFLPCVPRNYTPEMEKFLMDSCKTVASARTCRCIVKDIERAFTLEQLIRRTLADPSFIQGYTTGAAIRCKDE